MADVLIDAAVYRDGTRFPVWDISDALEECHREQSGFLWVGLKEPDGEEFAHLAAELGLHPLAVEDAVTGHQRPKLEFYDRSTFLVLKTVKYIDASSDVETGEILLFIGDRYVVTVRQGEIAPLSGVRARLERDPGGLNGTTTVVYAVVDAVIDTYMEVETELEIDLRAVEEQVFRGQRGEHATTVYLLKREVMEFRRAAYPLLDPLRRLTSTRVPFVDENAQPFFRDVSDHLVRVVEQLDGFDRLLSDVLSAHLSQVSLQQNTDMRKISSWAAIAAFPTMLAGIYGMNFEHMPELAEPWAYPLVLCVMVFVCVHLYQRFRKSGWL